MYVTTCFFLIHNNGSSTLSGSDDPIFIAVEHLAGWYNNNIQLQTQKRWF